MIANPIGQIPLQQTMKTSFTFKIMDDKTDVHLKLFGNRTANIVISEEIDGV